MVQTPLVSFLLVSRNEEGWIERALQSLLARAVEFGENACEVVAVDGVSTDRTREIVEKIAAGSPPVPLVVLENRRKTLASGWNLGIKHARGEFVVRPDAHGYLEPGYVRVALEILADHPEVAAVGGVLETRAKGFFGEIIREALSSPVGVGNSAFRTGAVSGHTDTAVFAVYRKKVFDQVGLFDERLVRHQDNEMHHRIRWAGWRLWTDRRMRAVYYCRDNPAALFRQMYSIGYHLPELVLCGATGGIRPRNFAPFAFYAFTLSAVFGGLLDPVFLYGLLPFAGYILVIGTLSGRICRVRRNHRFLHLLWIIPGMHMAYGLGTTLGMVVLPFKALQWRSACSTT